MDAISCSRCGVYNHCFKRDVVLVVVVVVEVCVQREAHSAHTAVTMLDVAMETRMMTSILSRDLPVQWWCYMTSAMAFVIAFCSFVFRSVTQNRSL